MIHMTISKKFDNLQHISIMQWHIAVKSKQTRATYMLGKKSKLQKNTDFKLINDKLL